MMVKLALISAVLVSAALAQSSVPLHQRPSNPLTPLAAGGQGQGQGQGQDQGQGGTVEGAIALWCRSQTGTVPYWLDPSCRSYLACTQDLKNLTLQVCPPGSAYSYPQQACQPAWQMNCSLQNEEFARLVRDSLQPLLAQGLSTLFPSLLRAAFTAARNGDTNADKGQQQGKEGEDEDGMTINLDDLPSILVDTSNSLNVTLEAATCDRLAGHVTDLQTSLNMALLMLTGCPERGCDVTLFRLLC